MTVRKFFKYAAYFLTFNWGLVLFLFFRDPEGMRMQIDRYYNWATDKHFRRLEKPETCIPYQSVAWRMNDRFYDYWDNVQKYGVERQKGVTAIRNSYKAGKLSLVEANAFYQLDTMYYSYAFLTPKAKSLLDTIAARFHKKLVFSDLKGTQLTVTSLLRTEHSVARLRKRNKNALKNSAHLHGTAFDLSYATYFLENKQLSRAHASFLREVLAETLFELRTEKRCWVTYEINQTCFHVVSRTENETI